MHGAHALNTELSFVRSPFIPYFVSAPTQRVTDAFAKLSYLEHAGE
jgi:hypothetical protein